MRVVIVASAWISVERKLANSSKLSEILKFCFLFFLLGERVLQVRCSSGWPKITILPQASVLGPSNRGVYQHVHL